LGNKSGPLLIPQGLSWEGKERPPLPLKTFLGVAPNWLVGEFGENSRKDSHFSKIGGKKELKVKKFLQVSNKISGFKEAKKFPKFLSSPNFLKGSGKEGFQKGVYSSGEPQNFL